VALALPASADAPKGPPPTRTDNVRETVHGVEVVDPFRWLEDQTGPETRAWIDAQRRYTESVLSKLPGREAIKKRLTELLRVDTTSAPTVANNRYFYSKRKADQDLPVFYVRKGFTGPDEVLLDCNTLSPDKTVSAATLDVAEDGSVWVYGVRQGGEDETTVQMMEVDSHRELPDRLPKARYFGVALKKDKSGFYYARMNKDGPRVYNHAMGRPPAEDAEVFGKGYGPDKIITCRLTEDGRWLGVTVMYGSAARKSEVYVKDVSTDGPVTPIVNDVDARFVGSIGGDTLYLMTNWQAPNNRLLAVDLRSPARDNWKEVVPEAKNVMQGFSLAGGRLFVRYLENVATRERIFDPLGRPRGEVKYPGIGTGGVAGRWDRAEAFFSFTSFVTPPEVWRYDVEKGRQELWAKTDAPIRSDRFEVKQVRYRSKDGTEVPMFLVHRKGLALDGNNPTYLTGYGGFNLSRTPAFSASAALWVEHGGVFALPSLRGGGEFGEPWHQAGMLAKKQNVFDDFVAAGEWLIANKYTNPDRLAIAGGSNGGLLVGAALTQRPDLFRAVVCSVPLLDMVRYHRFLVARFWVPEYGSSENPEQFKYIAAYSPYHHVKPGTKYPAVMFVTGDSDTRVDPLHARKMCALLQSATASGPDRPVLLHYDTKSGHAGGKPVSQTIDDLTDEFAFLFWQLGVKT
jgi:prolyl oligopeptidase